MINRIVQLIVFFAFTSTYCVGQAHVEKIAGDEGKAVLRIAFEKDGQSLVFSATKGYSNNLNDSEKLQLIACLLTFEGDTTQHPGMVHPIYFGSSERNLRFSPKSKYFTVEICALYFIDRIAYGTDTDYYSPAPVLFDTEEKVEINDNPEKVKVVFEAYKKWFSECIERGKIPKYFPFNDGRYVWYYGKKSLHPKVGPRNPFR